MRGEATPEDKIPCIVLARLKKELNLTYEAISADVGIPATTLSGIVGLSAIGHPGRIKKLAEYFRNVHGLSYVDADYFLTGGPEDAERIESVKQQHEIERVKKEQKKNGVNPDERPPFLDLVE